MKCLFLVIALYDAADGSCTQGKVGVMFQWRHQGGDGSDGWQDDLAQLSGGQRSLCAVALLVAVSFFWIVACIITAAMCKCLQLPSVSEY